MKFYDLFIDMCSKKNVKPSVVALECGISKSNISNWKRRGTYPTDTNLKKLADYFGVSTDYLLSKEKTATQMDDSLSAEFTALYSRLDENHQAAVLSLIESLLDSQ